MPQKTQPLPYARRRTFQQGSHNLVAAEGCTKFIVTLAVMQSARGLVYKLAGGPSPLRVEAESFNRLGGGADLFGIPNPVVLMAVLYLAASLLMSHTVLGRYIFAVGGNLEAARLSGVPVNRVLVFVYVICGALAGLGGIVNASLFRVGDPTSGVSYELQIIAAVVVGGTSLAGGEGKIFGTLIGALILTVIRNGMYLMKVDSYANGRVRPADPDCGVAGSAEIKKLEADCRVVA